MVADRRAVADQVVAAPRRGIEQAEDLRIEDCHAADVEHAGQHAERIAQVAGGRAVLQRATHHHHFGRVERLLVRLRRISLEHAAHRTFQRITFPLAQVGVMVIGGRRPRQAGRGCRSRCAGTRTASNFPNT